MKSRIACVVACRKRCPARSGPQDASLPVEPVAVSLARSVVRFCAVVIANIIVVISDNVGPFSPNLFHQTFFHNFLPSFRIRTSASALQSRHAHGTLYGEISGTGSS